MGDSERLRRATVMLLLELARQPRLPPPVLVPCARALGVTLCGHRRMLRRRLRAALAAIERGRERVGLVDRRLGAVLTRFDQAGPDVHRLREAGLATESGMSAAHLGRCLRARTGLTFRECGWAVALRAALPGLLDPEVPLKRVAADAGFGAMATKQLARCVRHTVGVSPTTLRRALLNLQAHVDAGGAL
jgi:AraC-like DNA-binding protein